MEHGWGNSWGIPFRSTYEMPDLHKHFRKFLKVDTEDGQQMYFRFYDPRVLRIFLPNSEAGQVREFFGPVEYFIAEDEDPATFTKYSQINGALKTQRTTLADVYKPPVKVEVVTEETIPEIIETKQPKAIPAADSSKNNTPKETTKPPTTKSAKWNMFD